MHRLNVYAASAIISCGLLSCAGEPGAGDSEGETSTTGDEVDNLIENGDFDLGTQGWTPTLAVLSVVDGALRVETQGGDGGQPGLATQAVALEVGARYRISASFGPASYEGSSQIRVGSDINLGEFASIFLDTPSAEFEATAASVVVTCNNVAADDGEFADFDDVVLVRLP